MRNQRWSWALLATAGLLACSSPTLDGAKWRCSTNADCGDDAVCSVREGHCIEGLDGTLGVYGDRLVMGMSSPITSGPTALGVGMKAGIEAAFAAVNKNGGVHGRRLELVALDDGYEPDKALANVKQMVEQKTVFGLIGNVGTPTANVTVPYAVMSRTIFFGAFTGAGLLRKDPPDRYVFNYRASYREETEAIVKYFTHTRDRPVKPRNIGVLPQGEDSEGHIDAYGQSGFDGVAKALKEGFEIQAAEIPYWTYRRNTVDVKPAIKTFLKWLGSGRPEKENGQIYAAIVMVPTYKPGAAFVKGLVEEISKLKRGGQPDPDFALTMQEVDELKLVEDVIFSSVSFVGANDFANELNGFGRYTNLAGAMDSFCTNVIVTQVVPHFSSSASAVIEYRDQLAAHDPNQMPGFVSLEGYLAARVFVEGLKAHGRSITPETFIDTLESLNAMNLGMGTTLSFSQNRHQASDKVWGTKLDTACAYSALEL